MRLNLHYILGILGFLMLSFVSCKKKDPYAGATITGLACSGVSFSNTATAGNIYSATATIAYSGGNGVSYSSGSAISSTGVTGLSAVLQAATLNSGNGNLTFLITGTPSMQGIASFPISFGGQSCSINLMVNSNGGGSGMPAAFNLIYGATSITYDGTFVTVKTSDQPNHKSVYWPTNNPLYEAFSGPTFNNLAFNRAPNNIQTQNITLKIPAFPTVAATHAATPMGVIGVALDGVPFFNQYAAGGTLIADEIHGFDQYWAHPQMSGMYHYHVEPKFLTQVYATRHSLLGFLLDGFPVYGPEENDGSIPTGLDEFHGHTHTTTEYPAGIYHYHFTADAPYLNGNGFYGTKGTVTQ